MLLAAKHCRKVKTEAALPALGARRAHSLWDLVVCSALLLLMEQGRLQNIIQCEAQTWPSIFSLIHTEMSWPKGAGGCHQLIFYVSKGTERTAAYLTGGPVSQSR